MYIPTVLHPDVVEFLRNDSPKKLSESIGLCIQKLRQRQFDGGLRVKKLRGIAKRVWEARIDRASRMIFTYEKSREPQTGEAQVYIAVQDICLDHDDVSRRAKARKKTPDAEWLDADVVEDLLPLESGLSTGESTGLEAIEAEELEISADGVDELLGNIQWRVLSSELDWQRSVMSQDADLPLKLTPEEYALVKMPGNVLLSGSAGTGKTTVALYRLLESNLPPGKRLYIAYNKLLVNSAREQFERLVRSVDGDEEIGNIAEVFEFKTLRNLCREIIQASGDEYRPDREVNWQMFSEMYRGHPKRKQYPTALIWDEIRSIIKGGQLSLRAEMLVKKDYEKLGKKRSSAIAQQSRREVYQLAEWYQKKLASEGLFDEIDLARKVLQMVKQGQSQLYQLIVCDEVQDLTELQLELLWHLLAPEGKVFFAGDLHQMINPSGFRWEELKQKFYRNQSPVSQKNLYFNFRSVGSLVSLANQILQLRSRLLKEPKDSISQPGGSYGELARVVQGTRLTLVEMLQATSLNPGEAILVRTETEKTLLAQELASSFVFTVEEAKGLEFDTVFLVEFCQLAGELWEKVLREQSLLKEKEKPHLQLELNLLYVAITRARRILNIWESSPSTLWHQPELKEWVSTLIPEMVKSDRTSGTPETWRKQGLYYLQAQLYEQALECFVKSGDGRLELEAKAQLMMQKRVYKKAANIWVELSEWQQAAQLFAQAKEWQRAADCWAKVGNSAEQLLCAAYALEAAQKWQEAAQKWEELERPADAKRCWMNIPEKKAAYLASDLEKKKQWLKAAEQYELAGMPEKAEACRIEHQPADAAMYMRRSRQRADRKDIKGALKDWERLVECDPTYVEEYRNSDLVHQTAADYLSKLKTERVDVTATEVPHLLRLHYREQALGRQRQQDYKGAIAYWDKQLQILPDDGYVYKQRGIAYVLMKKIRRGIEDLTIAAQQDPDDAEIYNYRGQAHQEIKKYTEAIADYNVVLKIKPSDAEVYKNRGRAWAELQKYDLALDDFTKSLQLNPLDSQAYYNRGTCRMLAKDYDELALEDLNRCLQLNPQDMKAYYNRGICYAKQKKYAEAVADYSKCLAKNPNSLEGYYHRGASLSEMGKYSEAIADFNKCLQMNPQDIEAYYNRALTRRAQGDYQGAIVDFSKALRIAPENATLYYNRGIVWAMQSDYKKAIADYEQALALKPGDPNGYAKLGEARAAVGDFDGALKDYNQAISVDKSQADAYFGRGKIYLEQGNASAALKNFEFAAAIYYKREQKDQLEAALDMMQELKRSHTDLELTGQ